ENPIPNQEGVLEESRVLSQVRRQQEAPVVGDPTTSASLSRPLCFERNEGWRWHGASNAQDPENIFDRVDQNERCTIEWNDPAQRARDRLEHGLPVEAGHDGVVHLKEDPPALLGKTQLRRTSFHELLKIRAETTQLFSQTSCLD